jgi:hypothetical protein
MPFAPLLADQWNPECDGAKHAADNVDDDQRFEKMARHGVSLHLVHALYGASYAPVKRT